MKMPVERIEGCESKQEDFLSRAKTWITETRKAFEKEMSYYYQSFSCFPKTQCFIRILALFLMAEKVPRFDDEISRAISRIAALYVGNNHTDNIQRMTEDALQIEQYLWTLYLKREVSDGSSFNDGEAFCSHCFSAIEGEPNKSHILCLMLWLFPELATGDRIKAMENMEMKNFATWLLRDKMLFWLACLRDSNCSPEKVNGIESQVRGFQLVTATVKQDANVCLISPAIGLLVLISCSKRNHLEGADMDSVQEMAHWIMDQLSGTQDVDESSAWALYALSEYVALYR